jgi:hypothetical protein
MRYLLLLLLASTAFGATLDHAYYAPDRGTPYKWFEGAREIQQFLAQDYRAAGYLCAYVRNDGRQPIEATGFTVDGKPLADLRKANTVVWWRLLPRPLAPGMVGEIMVRPRNPLTAPCVLTVSFSDASRVTARITPQPNPLRIGTIGYSGNRVFLVAESVDSRRHELAKVLLDGVDVTNRCHLLAPKFIAHCSPVTINLRKPLALGSYHVFTVVTRSGKRASCCLRKLDGFVPLGSYGNTTLEEYARNGCNSYANFSRSDEGLLADMARLGMRGASTIGDSPVEKWEVGNPGLYAHYLADEPDCADYIVNELPHPLRIGQHAMDMDQRAETVRRGNPTIPSFLTLDLTYKPANYYIYAPIADIVNPDCYPISGGRDMTEVREVVETCRLAAGPRPLTFTFQGVLEGPRDAAKFAQKRFPRQNFAAEQRLMLYYAIGAGARGLYNYIHCTENSATNWSRGTSEFPDLWNEIGLVYRELEHVAPLLTLAHPTQLATSKAPKLWLRTLLCGDQAALIAWANDDYEQHRLGFRYQPLSNVRISLPDLPWLGSWKAYAVGQGAFQPLRSSAGGMLVPRADVAGMILVTPDARLPRQLAARYDERQRELGRLLLEEQRRTLQEQAQRLNLTRLITGELTQFAVEGQGVGAYGMSLDSFWNPKEAQYNVLEWGANDRTDTDTGSAEFGVAVPPGREGQPHVVYAMAGAWGPPLRLTITSPDGRPVSDRAISESFSGGLIALSFTPSQAGEYRLRFHQPGPGSKGARVSTVIYVLPASEAFAPLPRGQ